MAAMRERHTHKGVGNSLKFIDDFPDELSGREKHTAEPPSSPRSEEQHVAPPPVSSQFFTKIYRPLDLITNNGPIGGQH